MGPSKQGTPEMCGIFLVSRLKQPKGVATLEQGSWKETSTKHMFYNRLLETVGISVMVSLAHYIYIYIQCAYIFIQCVCI